MIGIDTSVFLHFLVDDDPRQHCAARTMMASDGAIVEYADEPGLLPGQGNEPKVEFADDLPGWAGVAAGGARTVTFDSNVAGIIPSMERHT